MLCWRIRDAKLCSSPGTSVGWEQSLLIFISALVFNWQEHSGSSNSAFLCANTNIIDTIVWKLRQKNRQVSCVGFNKPDLKKKWKNEKKPRFRHLYKLVEGPYHTILPPAGWWRRRLISGIVCPNAPTAPGIKVVVDLLKHSETQSILATRISIITSSSPATWDHLTQHVSWIHSSVWIRHTCMKRNIKIPPNRNNALLLKVSPCESRHEDCTVKYSQLAYFPHGS